MHHGAELGVRRRRIKGAHVVGGAIAHDSEQRRDGRQDAGDPAERERRGAEPGNLAILRTHEGAYQLHRIGRGISRL